MLLQRSFDDMGSALADVTFVVLDLETTGGSPAADAITEIGAVKLRGGESLGTFQTLVNPGMPIPPMITVLTGISQAMVYPAPKVNDVLATFLEFLGDAVIVGHNVSFDMRFLQTNLARAGHLRLANDVVDTCSLARRLLRDEVSNCKLSTLATEFRLHHVPTHRALDDALATGELLHVLLERAGSLGVTALDDLLALPTVASHPQVQKLKLLNGLPRTPGVYLFKDARGRTLYVGKAVNLRRRVRQYFSGDERKKVGRLLQEVERIDHICCRHELEAEVLEVRLIQHLEPHYNARSKHWRRYCYVALTTDEQFPRLSIVRRQRAGRLHLGPFGSRKEATLVIEGLQTALPLRRCTKLPSKPGGGCLAAQLGTARCPCDATVTPDEYASIVSTAIHCITIDPSAALLPLETRMRELASAHRYEEAAELRARADALARSIARRWRVDALRNAGRLEIQIDGAVLVLEAGRLQCQSNDPQLALQVPQPADDTEELRCIDAWLERHPASLKWSDNGFAWPAHQIRRYEPALKKPAGERRHVSERV